MASIDATSEADGDNGNQASRPSSNAASAGVSPVVLTGEAAANDPDLALATPSVAAASATLMLATTLSMMGTGTSARDTLRQSGETQATQDDDFGAVLLRGVPARQRQAFERSVRVGGDVRPKRLHGPHRRQVGRQPDGGDELLQHRPPAMSAGDDGELPPQRGGQVAGGFRHADHRHRRQLTQREQARDRRSRR